MRRASPKRFPSAKVFAIGNLIAIALLYAYVQWRIDAATAGAVRLKGPFVDTSEQDTASEASDLEALAKARMMQDKQLRAMAPPMDWEAIASEGAARLAVQWNNTQDKQWFKQPGYHLAYPEADPPYPFQRIKFTDGRDTGVTMVAAPFFDTNYYRAEAARGLFWRLKAKGHIMVGITSYQEFPGSIMNPFDDRHTTQQDQVVISAIDAWLHCFREPDKTLPVGVPRLLLSESDFHDPDRNDGGGVLIPDPSIAKEYDMVYSNQGGEWNDFARNWTLAKASMVTLITELNFKVLLLGREIDPDKDKELLPFLQSGQLVKKPPGTPWRDFLKLIQTSRSLFVPNIHDASPRVVAEALCLGVPVVMNQNIVGGWKYINEQTGELFMDAHDIVPVYQRLRARAAELRPREWYRSNWGKETASYRLQAFLEAAAGEDRLHTIQRDLAAFEQARQT